MHRRLRSKKPWKDGTTVVVSSDDSSEDNNSEDSLASDNSSDMETSISPNNDITSDVFRVTRLRTFKTYGKVKWKARKLSNEWEAAKKSIKPDACFLSGKKWSVNDKLKNIEVDNLNDENLNVNGKPKNARKSLFHDINIITPIKHDVINDIGSPAKHSTPLRHMDLLLTTPVNTIKDSLHLKDAVGFHRSIIYLQSPLKNNSNIQSLLGSNKALSSLSLLKPDKSVHTATKGMLEVSPIITIEGRILNLCEQESIINMNHYVNGSNCPFIRKIAEGSYGEVFEKKNENRDSIIVKIVPVGCKEVLVNGIPQMNLEEVISEMAISKTLSGLKEINNGSSSYKTEGFIQLHRLLFCQGCYPCQLIKLWECWDCENESENDNPKMLMSDQMYIIFETDYCGTDLEHFKVKNQTEAFSILKQVVASLAAAENIYQFEHRDLHWGNILIMDTNKKTIDFIIADEEYSFDSSGVVVSIIDFTLSRIQGDECVLYTDLRNEKDLFKGQGDIQFNVYRDMKEHNGNNWESFNPYTNVFWIHYLTKKLIKKVRNTGRLKGFLRQVLTYNSAFEILKLDEFIH